LLKWSIDLEEFVDDRKLRNEVSYRPQRLRTFSRPAPLDTTLRNIIDLWHACEPTTTERFSTLDIHLLRAALQGVYRFRIGRAPRGSAFEHEIKKTFANLGLPANGTLYEFLAGNLAPDNHSIFIEAKKHGKNEQGILQPLSVIARAFLMLRLASAAVNDLLLNAAVSSTSISFWLNTLGADIGLWDNGAAPAQMVDLWSDIQPAIDSISQWCDLNLAPIYTLNARRDLPYDLWQFKHFERAGLWAIGL
jgi:hypothetical protein